MTKTSGTSWVYDLSVAPDGQTVYLAGKFNRVDGSAHVNLARFDGATGALDAAFVPLNAPPAKSVLATDTDAYVGGKKLVAYHLDGSKDATFGSVLAGTDSALRPGHVTEPAFRDLTLGDTSDGTMLVVACQCDTLQDSSGTTYPSKAIVEIDPATGLLRQSWVPSNLQTDSAAFGVAVIVHTAPGNPLEQVAYLAAGGSDFTAAYDVETGAQIFKTDTSGSSQAIAWFSPDDVLVVGGHFHYTESPTTPQCGQNSDPTPGCYFTPLLTAMDPSDGHVIVDSLGNPWNPGLCCKYNGVWSLLETQPTDGSQHLYVGGEFTKAGGTWNCTTFGATCLVGEVKQQFVARFTEPAII